MEDALSGCGEFGLLSIYESDPTHMPLFIFESGKYFGKFFNSCILAHTLLAFAEAGNGYLSNSAWSTTIVIFTSIVLFTYLGSLLVQLYFFKHMIRHSVCTKLKLQITLTVFFIVDFICYIRTL